jgi:uncharacterized protein (TIGR03083 family)
VSTAIDTMDLAAAERSDLVALLEGLSDEQWDGSTLCTEWSVRQVVAHVFSYDELSKAGMVGLMLRAGLRPGRANDLGVAAHAADTPDQLLDLARTHLRPRGLTAGFGGRIALTDGLIHQQDIRRPLGLDREIPDDRLRAALEFGSTARPIGAKRRIQGLTMVATDVGWRSGDGPAVEGPGEALILAMAGRRGIDGELTGPGLSTLVSRIEG